MNETYFQAIWQIITTGHWITDQVTLALKPLGTTEPQYNVLRILQAAKGEPVAAQDILEGMVQRSSNITRIVDKLVAKGLVERKECPTNRRKMDISITELGQLKLHEMDANVHVFHQAYYNKLNDEELDTLKNLIQKLKS
ncbi:MAG: MarR family transcriptional regulator [Bacteroidota bacterium]